MLETLLAIGQSIAVLVGAAVLLYLAHTKLIEMYAGKPALQYRRQLVMLALSIAALILVIILIPIGDEMRGQLLSLLGILLSATIALSSTTIVGNAMAGLMLKTVQNIKPGDFIFAGDHEGRVSEMDLLHVEIQTEDRNLTTLPNLFLVTNPVTVLRDTGTIVSVEVSLGYDVSRRKVEKLLIEAANQTELESPFVQIMNLGDFSITYRIAGLATDLGRLISTRRTLRSKTLDLLHSGGVEIVSPTHMMTRALDPARPILPPVEMAAEDEQYGSSPDDIVFDKARKAESIENLRASRQALDEELQKYQAMIKESSDEKVKAGCEAEIAKINDKIERLDRIIEAAEAKILKEQ